MNPFNHKNLTVINNNKDLINYLSSLEYFNLALLMMSSGKFEGLDLGIINDFMKKYETTQQTKVQTRRRKNK